jgi:hypothetical protein
MVPQPGGRGTDRLDVVIVLILLIVDIIEGVIALIILALGVLVALTEYVVQLL